MMGVLKSHKKLPRRIKKAIRRSLSAVCMISAIIVALVPAQVSEGYSTISDEKKATDNPYEYGVATTGDDIDLNLGDTLKLDRYDADTDTVSGGKTLYTTKYVRKASDGSFEYGWQFKIYLDKYNGVQYGVICAYNSSYQADTLEINKSLAYEYTVVTNAEYEEFFQYFQDAYDNGKKTTFTISGDVNPYKACYTMSEPSNSVLSATSSTTQDEYFIKKYFSDDYSAHLTAYKTWETNKAKYDTYLEKKAAWDASDKTTAEPTAVADPGAAPTLTEWVKDIPNSDNTDLLRRTYFCEVNQKYNTSINGYVLVSVKDYITEATGVETPTVYLAQGVENPTGDASIPNDKYGFHVKASTDVIAIGNGAFKGTTNVYNLTLSDDMAFVGDEAFMNSFVRSISFSNVGKIGNRAFKGCSQLTSITFESGTTTIGTEAFYGCGLKEVSFPYSVDTIGPGAFADCSSLTKVDMSEIAQPNATVGGFAFYDDIALNTVTFSDTITTLGDACFAVEKGVTGSLTTFTFPKNITTIGDYLLAGRGNLATVYMPENLGRTASPAVNLPENLFKNCYNMECLVFRDDGQGSCGYINFANCTNIFSSITNENFYVQGPELNANKTTALPRKSTWGKVSGAGLQVPYVYVDSNNNQLYEISDDDYLLVIDSAGVLQSCTFLGTPVDFEMTIPSKVGQTAVTGVSSTCFSNEDIKEHMTKLIIKDDTLSEIADEAFKDFTNLTRVELGNSVTKIGDSAFEGCTKLTYVKFATPSAGYDAFPVENIGTNAFATGASSLIFEGDIKEGYGPFEWAMDVNNFVDADDGIRVCYYTGAPDYLTVIVDNKNGLSTLINYPHYDELNAHSGTTSDTYPLTTRYEHLGEEVVTGDDVYIYSTTAYEDKLIDKTLNIVVPAGIDSIDVYGYMNNKSQTVDDYSSNLTNTKNVATYFANASSPVYCQYYNTYREYGLFSGYYGAYTDEQSLKKEYSTATEPDITLGAKYETDTRGNDRIESVTLNTVKYLPENVFYSCEKLSSMSLGADLTEMGAAPFTGCTNITSVGGTTDDFICYNGIVYSVNSDGSYNIVEVLSSRGLSVGSQKIKVSDDDPYLASVTTISDGAFENCDYITGVDFRGVTGLTEIPDDCFKDCSKLNQVILPENITSVGHDAFADTMDGIEIVCYGEEVYLPHDAFTGVDSMRVISYEDSAVRKAAKDLGADVSETLDETVKVQFFDYDGTELSNIIYVTVGEDVSLSDIPEDPVRDGYTFKGWNKALTDIETDTVIVATYEASSSSGSDTSDSTSTSGSTSGSTSTSTSTSSGSGNGTGTGTSGTMYTLTVTNGNGSGSYVEGATVIITCTNPPSGKTFDKWVPGTDDLGIASVNVAATTLVMPAHEATVEATFKDSPTNASSSGSGSSTSTSTNGSSSTNGNSGSSVVISKSGISNSSLASATVSGSTDNYIIRISENPAATTAVETALENEYGSLDNIRYSAMDITLYDETGQNQITDYSGLSITITMPIPDTMVQYAGNNKVAGVVNEKLDKLDAKFTTIDGVSCVTFKATHFSPYTIYVNVENLGEGATVDASPKTADGIAPKWFLSFGLAALSIALFFMKDKKSIANLNLN